ncbi:MAG: hypothetical protein ABIK89_14035 [Planctomycetota bacterium]
MRPPFVCSVVVLLAVLSTTFLLAAPPDLGFKPADEEGFYAFNTGVLQGKVRLNGTSQGITEVVHVPSGQSLAVGGRLPGLVSYYRVFSGNTRFGNAARDWPTETTVLPDGALRVFWPGAEGHPLEITADHRWTRPDTLDVITTVKPLEDMPAFELFLSSYYEKAFLARVYVKPAEDAAAGPRFVPVDRTPESKGGYVMFPRDQAALDLILDGRWKVPPSPVDWDQVCWLASPLAVRRDETSGLSAVTMAPPEDCFAIASPYNPATPDAGGYRSLYLSFFGQDLKAGQTAQARYRLVVAQNLSDEQTVKLYEEYVHEQNR